MQFAAAVACESVKVRWKGKCVFSFASILDEDERLGLREAGRVLRKKTSTSFQNLISPASFFG